MVNFTLAFSGGNGRICDLPTEEKDVSKGPYKQRTGHTGQCMNHAPAILAAPAVYRIHCRIIRQARGRQAVQNVGHMLIPGTN